MPSNRTLRIACAAVAAALAALAYAVQGLVDPRVQALTGILMCGWSTGFFFAVVNRLYDAQTRVTTR